MPQTAAPPPAVKPAVRDVAEGAFSPPAEPTAEYANGVRVVAAEEFNELDAAADDVKVVPANVVNEIDLAAGPPVMTDGRNPESAAPIEPPPAGVVTWPLILAFGLGAPLLIGLLAWPLIVRRRPVPTRRYRRSA